MSDKARDTSKDFNTAGNTSPDGLWSDGTTMWIVDFVWPNISKIYAYKMSDKSRDSSKDFSSSTLTAAGNTYPYGVWSNGTTMWVSDFTNKKIYAYNMGDKKRDSSQDFTLDAGTRSQGIWSDGTTMWVSDFLREKIYAYNLKTKAYDSNKDFNTLKDAGQY